MSANTDAIGLPVEELETPALCLDIEVYGRNVGRIRDFLAPHGLGWRPHMKGQKAPELAREALAQGAIGVTCATLYEAETMLGAGVTGVLIAHEIAGARKLRRLARLAKVHPGALLAATDSMAHAAAMNEAALAEGTAIETVAEVNVGMNRCGVAAGEAAVELARAVAGMPGLRFAGVMGWEGHTVPMEGEAKGAAVGESCRLLNETAEMMRAAGLAVGIVSASGSGTFRQSAGQPGLTEVQAGGGVFCDLSYRKWGLDHEFALTVLTRVVSRPSAKRAIVDAGFKTMSVQHGLPQPLGIEAVGISLSAEHGTVDLAAPSERPAYGETVRWAPGYTDSTVCLHDEMCVVRNGLLEAVWAIPGRTGRR
ncbi:MAG: alanine racemase [Bryobacteraceae bacterium]